MAVDMELNDLDFSLQVLNAYRSPVFDGDWKEGSDEVDDLENLQV